MKSRRKIPFSKMEALGNDYILIDGIKLPDLIERGGELARSLCDRHRSVGGDGVIFTASSEHADLKMRMFNANGSEAEMCGNGIRQLAKFAVLKGLVSKRDLTVETLAGTRSIVMEDDSSACMERIQVDMGAPILAPEKIPAIAEIDAKVRGSRLAKRTLAVEDRTFDFFLVSMGNPHAIAFVDDDLWALDVDKYGRPVEGNTLVFPRRTNVEFVRVRSRTKLEMRVFERGSGETLACGTGACASVVAAVLNDRADRKSTVRLCGGELEIDWRTDNHVIMTGTASLAFEGEFDFEEQLAKGGTGDFSRM